MELIKTCVLTNANVYVTIVWYCVGETSIAPLMIALVHLQNMWVEMQLGNIETLQQTRK